MGTDKRKNCTLIGAKRQSEKIRQWNTLKSVLEESNDGSLELATRETS